MSNYWLLLAGISYPEVMTTTLDRETLDQIESQPSPDPQTMQNLVYEYLVHNCYGETAKSFAAAAQIAQKLPQHTMDLDSPDGSTNAYDEDFEMESVQNTQTTSERDTSIALKTLQSRKRLREYLVAGNVSNAISYCEETFPADMISKDSVEVLFALKCQQFIELLRNDPSMALQFAQEELGQFGPQHQPTLQDIVSLIAYPDPHKSPLAHYLSQERRDQVANIVNDHIFCT